VGLQPQCAALRQVGSAGRRSGRSERLESETALLGRAGQGHFLAVPDLCFPRRARTVYRRVDRLSSLDFDAAFEYEESAAGDSTILHLALSTPFGFQALANSCAVAIWSAVICFAILSHGCKHELLGTASPRRRDVYPHIGLHEVLRYATPRVVHHSEPPLRINVSLFCRLPIPLNGLSEILRNSLP